MNKYTKREKALLVLVDGTVFEGLAIGKKGKAFGELCFNTSMTGYQEVYTDPSYCGQILVATTSHIGNYGVCDAEVESNHVQIEGLVCNKFTIETYSRPLANNSLQNLFVNEGIVGISDIDTRSLVRHIREKGAMNAVISSDEFDIEKLKQELSQVPSMEGLELSSKVSTKEAYYYGDETANYRVAVIDLGVKKNILRCLAERGAYLKVFPMGASANEILSWQPDGIMISNGPGDPATMPEVVETIKQLINSSIPVFGICLGHQVIAIANGLTTYKMHNGHRGVNHPVKNLETGLCEITSQNHGFVVGKEEIINNPDIEITHIHLNDDTVAGIRMKSKKVFSVQYHPESSAGPNDSRYLFDQFIENIKSSVQVEN